MCLTISSTFGLTQLVYNKNEFLMFEHGRMLAKR